MFNDFVCVTAPGTLERPNKLLLSMLINRNSGAESSALGKIHPVFSSAEEENVVPPTCALNTPPPRGLGSLGREETLGCCLSLGQAAAW